MSFPSVFICISWEKRSANKCCLQLAPRITFELGWKEHLSACWQQVSSARSNTCRKSEEQGFAVKAAGGETKWCKCFPVVTNSFPKRSTHGSHFSWNFLSVLLCGSSNLLTSLQCNTQERHTSEERTMYLRKNGMNQFVLCHHELKKKPMPNSHTRRLLAVAAAVAQSLGRSSCPLVLHSSDVEKLAIHAVHLPFVTNTF